MARHRPKLSRENFATNRKLVDAVRALAADKGVTPAQLAIGWCLRLSSKVIPIPGSSKRERTLENVAAAHVSLSDEVRRPFLI
jgi:pyridoxine 4-dehydrogenase